MSNEQDEPAPQSGWTTDKQSAFLRELALTHNVSQSARAVGMSRQSAYQLRQRLRGEPFDRAWAAAFATVRRTLYHAALERAISGVEVPLMHRGEMIGTTRQFDERLTLALLAMKDPVPSERDPGWKPGSEYDPDDFNGLLARVESGPEEWEENETQNAAEAAWEAENLEDGPA